MTRETYESKHHRITVSIPKPLYNRVCSKLFIGGYSTMSDLVRELLRKWTEENIIEVKTHD